MYICGMRTRDEQKVALVKQEAIRQVAEEGLEDFSMNKLARACGISVATLYIYFKDKDDLIIRIAEEEGDRMGEAFLKDFDPAFSFEDGMRIQWRNRYQYALAQPLSSAFCEQIRSSSYQQRFLTDFKKQFKGAISTFIDHAVEQGEIQRMPLEVFWAMAYGPLYTLIRFHKEGQSIGGKKYALRETDLWQSFELMMRAFQKDR